MLTENTVSKLREMHLSVMAAAYKEQLSDSSFQSMPFEDRVSLIVDKEWNSRKNNYLKRIIKQANLSEPNACIEGIEYQSDRNLNKNNDMLISFEQLLDSVSLMLSSKSCLPTGNDAIYVVTTPVAVAISANAPIIGPIFGILEPIERIKPQ